MSLISDWIKKQNDANEVKNQMNKELAVLLKNHGYSNRFAEFVVGFNDSEILLEVKDKVNFDFIKDVEEKFGKINSISGGDFKNIKLNFKID